MIVIKHLSDTRRVTLFFSFQLSKFDAHLSETSSWLTDTQHRVDALNSQTTAEDRLNSAQVSSRVIGRNDIRCAYLRTFKFPVSKHQQLILSCLQLIMSSKTEGDSKLQELRRRVQSLCSQERDEPKKQEFQQKVRDAEEQWTSIIQTTKGAQDQAERQCALEGQVGGFKALSETTRTWLEDKQQSLESVSSQTDTERTINTAQVSLEMKYTLG